LARTSGDPAALVPVLKTLATRADPRLFVDRAETAALAITGVYVLMDDVSRLAGGLASLALVLGMAGPLRRPLSRRRPAHARTGRAIGARR
jgi:hypothetical protein